MRITIIDKLFAAAGLALCVVLAFGMAATAARGLRTRVLGDLERQIREVTSAPYQNAE